MASVVAFGSELFIVIFSRVSFYSGSHATLFIRFSEAESFFFTE